MSSTSASNGSDDTSAGEEAGTGTDTASQNAAGSGGLGSLTDRQKKILGVALVVHLVVGTLTLRDLRRRPAAAVRGPKRLWRLWVTMNTTGSVAYWLFGRRRPDDQL
jgi:hypothetical protein